MSDLTLELQCDYGDGDILEIKTDENNRIEVSIFGDSYNDVYLVRLKPWDVEKLQEFLNTHAAQPQQTEGLK